MNNTTGYYCHKYETTSCEETYDDEEDEESKQLQPFYDETHHTYKRAPKKFLQKKYTKKRRRWNSERNRHQRAFSHQRNHIKYSSSKRFNRHTKNSFHLPAVRSLTSLDLVRDTNNYFNCNGSSANTYAHGNIHYSSNNSSYSLPSWLLKYKRKMKAMKLDLHSKNVCIEILSKMLVDVNNRHILDTIDIPQNDESAAAFLNALSVYTNIDQSTYRQSLDIENNNSRLISHADDVCVSFNDKVKLCQRSSRSTDDENMPSIKNISSYSTKIEIKEEEKDEFVINAIDTPVSLATMISVATLATISNNRISDLYDKDSRKYVQLIKEMETENENYKCMLYNAHKELLKFKLRVEEFEKKEKSIINIVSNDKGHKKNSTSILKPSKSALNLPKYTQSSENLPMSLLRYHTISYMNNDMNDGELKLYQLINQFFQERQRAGQLNIVLNGNHIDNNLSLSGSYLSDEPYSDDDIINIINLTSMNRHLSLPIPPHKTSMHSRTHPKLSTPVSVSYDEEEEYEDDELKMDEEEIVSDNTNDPSNDSISNTTSNAFYSGFRYIFSKFTKKSSIPPMTKNESIAVQIIDEESKITLNIVEDNNSLIDINIDIPLDSNENNKNVNVSEISKNVNEKQKKKNKIQKEITKKNKEKKNGIKKNGMRKNMKKKISKKKINKKRASNEQPFQKKKTKKNKKNRKRKIKSYSNASKHNMHHPRQRRYKNLHSQSELNVAIRSQSRSSKRTKTPHGRNKKKLHQSVSNSNKKIKYRIKSMYSSPASSCYSTDVGVYTQSGIQGENDNNNVFDTNEMQSVDDVNCCNDDTHNNNNVVYDDDTININKVLGNCLVTHT